MDTSPIVPERLEGDLASGHDLTIRYLDGKVERSVVVDSDDPQARVRMVLRPFLEVEVSDGSETGAFIEIPLESLMGVDVDRRELRDVPPAEGEDGPEYGDVKVPMARWVRHPDVGLVRLSVIDQITQTYPGYRRAT